MGSAKERFPERGQRGEHASCAMYFVDLLVFPGKFTLTPSGGAKITAALSSLGVLPLELHLALFPQGKPRAKGSFAQQRNNMETVMKLAYTISALAFLATGAVTANAAPNDLFVSVGNTASSIYQYTPNGAQSVFASGFDRARGVAFDPAANLFVGNTVRDVANNAWYPQVIKVTPGGVQSLFATLPDNFFISGVAFDNSGNLFVVALDETAPELLPRSTKLLPVG